MKGPIEKTDPKYVYWLLALIPFGIILLILAGLISEWMR